MSSPRVSSADIAAAKARTITEVVGAMLPLNRYGFALCPFHAERTPSLHVWRQRNIWKCFSCGAAGDAIEFIRRYRGVDFSTAVAELCGGDTSYPGSPRSARQAFPPSPIVPAERLLPKILALWNAATHPGIALDYLSSRNIEQKALPDALRGHPAVWCSEVHEHRPAVLAALSDACGAIVAVQRIWVETKLWYDGHTKYSKGTRSPDLVAGKKTWGSMGASAVRLTTAGEALGIAEGVESALAAAMLFKMPVWATCGGSRLGSVELPEGVRHVVIFGDRGAAGEAEAAKAETAYSRRGYIAQSVFPESKSDFAEMVML